MTLQKPTVLLFDIDGTLTTTAGVGRRALERAFGDLFGAPRALDGVRFNGMTDRAIVRRGLNILGHDAAGPAAEAAIDATLARYLRYLEQEVREAPAFGLQPGVEPVLDAIAAVSGLAIGLGTGNVRRGAELKLDRFGLFARFAFGGYGCDHEKRDELLRIGAERGAAALGVSRQECRVLVIGDTVLDVAAALAIGAEAIGVCTGGVAANDLLDAGAAHVFADLTAAGVVEALVPRASKRN